MTRGVFSAGSNSSAAELGDCFDTKPRVRVYNSANQSVANATDQGLTFDSERFDLPVTSPSHSTSSSTSRLTVASGNQGYYHIGCNVNFASNATGTRRLAFWVNGITTGTRIAHVVLPAVSGAATVLTLTTYWALAAGDYVEVAAYQDSGAALNAVAAASYSPEFWMTWDAPA